MTQKWKFSKTTRVLNRKLDFTIWYVFSWDNEADQLEVNVRNVTRLRRGWSFWMRRLCTSTITNEQLYPGKPQCRSEKRKVGFVWIRPTINICICQMWSATAGKKNIFCMVGVYLKHLCKKLVLCRIAKPLTGNNLEIHCLDFFFYF